jgi:hypothetical protein
VPDEKIGDQIEVETAAHPPRTDSPEYLRSRKWLMGVVTGGCYICGGPVDLSHPDAPADAKGLQDHHGGGLYVRDVLVGFNLMPLEWSMGWGADPSRVTAFVQQLVDACLVAAADLAAAGLSLPFADTAAVMAWVDSTFNANVKLCAPHHVGHQTTHTPDANGHEAVGIHNAPWPVLAAQAVWDWSRGDMFGGTTGTVTVAPHPSVPGAAVVTYVHPAHPESLKVGQTLPATHGVAKALHAGAAAAA